MRGKSLVTDGPSAETKEQLGGFIIIEAADIEEAVAIAAEIPLGLLGCVEVRPLPDNWPPAMDGRAGVGALGSAFSRPTVPAE